MDSESAGNNYLSISGLNYSIRNKRVLWDVAINFRSERIHAVVGKSGSGKTSLGLAINGDIIADSGSFCINGERYETYSKSQAIACGVARVSSDLSLFPHLSVAENLLFSVPQSQQSFFFNARSLVKQAEEQLKSLQVSIDPRQRVSELLPSDQALINILKVINSSPDLIILDEALVGLRPEHVVIIRDKLQELARQGTAVVWITEQIEDVTGFADTVTVLKKGQVVFSDDVATITKLNLIKLCYSQESSDRVGDYYELLRYNEAILEKLPIAFIAFDRSNKIKAVNEYAQRYLNTPRHELINKELLSVIDEENGALDRFITEAGDHDEGLRKDGMTLMFGKERRILDVVVYPVREQGDTLGYVISFDDKTERENMRHQMMLSERLASVGMLAAGVAHEINNPLEIMSSCLRHLNRKLADNPLGEIVEEIDEEIAHLHSIVGSLVSFSGDSDLSVETFDLNDVIRRIVGLIKYNAEYKNVKVSFDSQMEQLRLPGNSNEIKQVILNLIRNSFEAMSDGGNINVHTHRDDSAGGSFAVVMVSDDGPGINMENPNDIFMPFYSTKKGTGSNMGLGLAIIYTIIEKHAGTITVENNSGAGCTFTIVLPVI